MKKLKLSCFPKYFMHQLVSGKMSLFEWIKIASDLDIEAIEIYNRFFESHEKAYLEKISCCLKEAKLKVHMICCSPDFSNPEKKIREKEIKRFKQDMNVAASFGASLIRTTTGQKYPQVSYKDGVEWVVECMETLLSHAQKRGVILALENHYKDDLWKYPEFAQKLDVFTEILDKIPSPHLKVNFDTSNSIMAEEDPVEVLQAVKDRVVSLHASDRQMVKGKLVHKAIGEGIVDFESIFTILKQTGFSGWVSIEDGVEGVEEIERSIIFLRKVWKQVYR